MCKVVLRNNKDSFTDIVFTNEYEFPKKVCCESACPIVVSDGRFCRCPVAAYARDNPLVTKEFLDACDSEIFYNFKDGEESFSDWRNRYPMKACGYCTAWKYNLVERRSDVGYYNGILKNTKRSLSNSAIVVIPSRNCEPWTGKCLRSILYQTYPDIGIVFTDDASTDRTADIAQKLLDGRKDVVFIRNQQRQYAMMNLVVAIRDYCSNPDSVIFTVDGDDWLDSPTAIAEMMEKHKTHDVVWSKYRRTDGSNEIVSGCLTHNDIRRHPWVSSQLRSFKKFLFDAIRDEDFRDNAGNYFLFTYDQAMMIPMLEMTPADRRLFYDSCLYVYNRENSDSSIDYCQGSLACENIIRSRCPYPFHSRYLNSSRKKVCFLVTATGRYIEFIKPLVESIAKWCKDFDFKVVVFTDSDETGCFEKVYIPHSVWPYPSVNRCRNYLNHSDKFDECDYVFSLDADTLFVGSVGTEIFGKTVATQHPGFHGSSSFDFSYERRMESSAFIPIGAGRVYYTGAFYGGEKKCFIEMLRRLVELTDIDVKNNIMALWHDESYLNRCLFENPPEKTLSPSYCCASYLADDSFEKKVVLVDKDQNEMRQSAIKNVSIVSIVIPSFNYGQYLQGAIQSVLSQTNQNFELILVDYGSTDNTVEIMSQYKDRAVVLSVPNKGYVNARNKGIACASGEYIFCLDADDKLCPSFLEEVIAVAGPRSIVATNGKYFKDGVVDGVWGVSDVDFESFWKSNRILSCSLFSKKMWVEIGGYDDKMERFEDWDFWLRALFHGYNVKVVPKFLVEMQRQLGSANTSSAAVASDSRWTGHIRDKMKALLGFNEEDYLRLNPDVKAEILSGRRFITSGWDHYVKYGYREVRTWVGGTRLNQKRLNI